MKGFSITLVVFVWLVSPTAWAKEGPYRVIQLPRHRVIHPVAAEPFAQEVARHLEASRTAAEEWIGQETRHRIDVVIRDPQVGEWGDALAHPRQPRMVIYTTPPRPSSTTATAGNWVRARVARESLVLAHRNRRGRGIWRPIEWALAERRVDLITPVWFSEALAMAFADQLDGEGAAFRARDLRRRALHGTFPAWDHLDTVDASVVGAAFVEWLVERRGQDAIQALSTHLSAPQFSRFGAVFDDVYGQPPERLYQQFCAEIILEYGAAEPPEESQQIPFGTFEPPLATSPFGDWMATFETDTRHEQLAVYPLRVDAEVEADWAEVAQKRRRRDPDGITRRASTYRLQPRRRRAKGRRTAIDPRFVDGDVLIGRQASRTGTERYDLVLWSPDTGRERRLTSRVDLRNADASLDGSFAVAVEHAFGRTRLVRVDLETGEIQSLTEWTLLETVASPRVSRSGERLVYLRRRGDHCDVWVRELGSGEARRLAIDPDQSVADPEWVATDRVVVEATAGGRSELLQVNVDDLSLDWMTASGGLARAPAYDGSHLVYADGPELHRVPVESVGFHRPEALDLPDDSTSNPAAVPPSKRYGAQGFRFLPTFVNDNVVGTRQLNVGLRFADATERRSGLALAGFGPKGGVTGGRLRLQRRIHRTAIGVDLQVVLPAGAPRPAVVGQVDVSRFHRGRFSDSRARVGVYAADQVIDRPTAFGTLKRTWKLPLLDARLNTELWGSIRLDGARAFFGRAGFDVLNKKVKVDIGYGMANADLFRAGGARTPLLTEAQQFGWVENPVVPANDVRGKLMYELHTQTLGFQFWIGSLFTDAGSVHSFASMGLARRINDNSLLKRFFLPGFTVSAGFASPIVVITPGGSEQVDAFDLRNVRPWARARWRF